MKVFSRSQRGFTLVELITVMAIIGILAGIGIGASYVRSLEKTRFAQAYGNLKTIHEAVELYYDDQNGYPPTGSPPGGTPALVPTYLRRWPTGPCGSSTYTWTNSGGNAYVSVTTGSTTYYFCVTGTCSTGTDIETVAPANQRLAC